MNKNIMEDCPHLKQEKHDETTVLVNKFDEDQVIVRVQDMIKFCFNVKCPSYNDCEMHEDIAEVLVGNFTDYKK